MLYLITYDLRQPGRDYAPVYAAIKALSTGQWCRPLESVWIVKSSLDVNGIYNRIKPLVDESDRFLVTELTDNISWYLDEKVSDYLETLL